MSRPIYRSEALQRLASPEQLDQLMPLTNPRGWLALAALGLLLAAALFWGLFGSVRTVVQGEGVLRRPGGVRTMAAAQTGVVSSIAVRIGQAVEPGEVLVRIAALPDPSARGETVVSPGSVRVVEIAVEEGETVEPKTPLITVESLAHPPEAIVFLPSGDGYQVQPGMEAQVFLSASRESQGESMRGRVLSAGRHPVAAVTMLNTLENQEWVSRLTAQSPCLEVIIALTPGPDRPGAGRRPPAGTVLPELFSGAPCRALITVGKRPPIGLILPSPSRGTGS